MNYNNMCDEIIGAINAYAGKEYPLIVAIDGRCGSGKTTLAANLQRLLDCSVVHMDDFFLRPSQRTEARYEEAGGNVDYERVLEDVLKKASLGIDFTYRPYDCMTQSMLDEVYIRTGRVIIVEGSYSCHPLLRQYYGLTIFLDVDNDEQIRRIRKRNGEEKLKLFKSRWIPLEEKYFSAFDIQNRCHMTYRIDVANGR